MTSRPWPRGPVPDGCALGRHRLPNVSFGDEGMLATCTSCARSFRFRGIVYGGSYSGGGGWSSNAGKADWVEVAHSAGSVSA